MATGNTGVALGLALLLGSLVSAQSASPDSLATAKTLRCAFRLVAIGTWKNREAQSEVKQTELLVVFTAINTEGGTAALAGEFGRSDIVAKISSGDLHLIHMIKEGPLYVTTVFQTESRPGKLKAVHTRHEYADAAVPGYTSSPEQYYGECEVGR